MIEIESITNTIINDDCMNILKQLPDKCVDLVLTDPPYGINISNNIGRRKGDKHSDYKKCDWDNEAPKKEVFNEIIRVSKNQIIWGANHFINNIPFNSSCWLVWDKLFSEDVSFASCELAYTSFKSVVKRYRLSSQQGIERFHPTQKPLKLFEMILNDYSNENDLVLDCFSGSGTTAVACHNLKRRFICIEKDKDYYKKSVERLKIAQAQLRFDFGA
ncbi:MAG: site-specific DNA-methyltransferase [Clostridia bacterium]|nr:site-specific DNA-methyltransferase [Clostridia bacterium]